MKKPPHYADIHVGKRLRQLRKLRTISQKDLVRRLSDPVTFQQLQKYEKGTNRLNASRLWELSIVLDVEPGYFFEGLENRNRLEVPRPSPVMKAAEQLSSLPKKDRNYIIFIINEVSKKHGVST